MGRTAFSAPRAHRNDSKPLVLRETNDLIYLVSLQWGGVDELQTFICECESVECRRTVEMNLGDYERRSASPLIAH